MRRRFVLLLYLFLAIVVSVTRTLPIQEDPPEMVEVQRALQRDDMNEQGQVEAEDADADETKRKKQQKSWRPLHYSITAVSPRVFVRTADFRLNASECLEFRYALSDRRTRLRGYACTLDEGGYCVLSKFYYPRNERGCARLQTWSTRPERYAFYFVLERRARRWVPERAAARRRLLRVQKRRRARRSDQETLGELTITGLRHCNAICDQD